MGELYLSGLGAYQGESPLFDKVFASRSAWVSVYKVVYADPSYITCSLNVDRIVYNKTLVEISGRVWGKNAISEAIPVRLQYSKDQGKTWQDLAEVYSDEKGAYSYKWAPSAGSYIVRSSWEGLPRRFAKALSSTSNLDVEKARVDVSVDFSSTIIAANNPVTVTCKLTPPLIGGTFHLEYSADNKTWTTVRYSSPVAGIAVIEWTPQKAGTYNLRVTYQGTESENPVSPWYGTVKVT